jgi:predicted Fe-S protein YdhL (DUF1289 family)
MDKITALCTGCFRSIDEITLWSRTDDVTRSKILTNVALRRQALDAVNGQPTTKNS